MRRLRRPVVFPSWLGMLGMLGVACTAASPDDSGAGERRGGPCRAAMADLGAELSIRSTVTEASLVEPIPIQSLVPQDTGRYPEGTPVVLYLAGAWQAEYLPVQDQRLRLLPGYGVAQVYLDLPDDKRGTESREHVGAVLRYAAGMIADGEGCTLPDRLGGPLSGQIVVAGFSNGGNLAWSALAWASGELPPVAGITTFETPTAGQFVLAESGTDERLSPLHAPGRCDVVEDAEDAALAIRCDYDYAGVAFDAEAQELFLDQNADGYFSAEADFLLGSVTDPALGQKVHSLPAREAAEAAGVAVGGRASVVETAQFWAEREAPRAVAGAVARMPALATIVVGTEEDHVLNGMEDHPHVTGLIEVAQRAGVRWTRLNPDAAYVTWTTRAPDVVPEQDANQEVRIDDLPELLPAGAESSGDGDDYLTAAVLELLDRAHDEEWGNDLDAILWR